MEEVVVFHHLAEVEDEQKYKKLVLVNTETFTITHLSDDNSPGTSSVDKKSNPISIEPECIISDGNNSNISKKIRSHSIENENTRNGYNQFDDDGINESDGKKSVRTFFLIKSSNDDEPKPETKIFSGLPLTTCEFCFEDFPNVNLKRSHKKSCPRPCPSYVNVETQQTKYETKKTGKYECKVCAMKFRTDTALKIHLYYHTGQKPFPCDECDKAFVRNYRLSVHKKLCHPVQLLNNKNNKNNNDNNDSNLTKCEICNRYVKDIYRHELYNHNVKRYGSKRLSYQRCEKCNKVFKDGNRLKVHKKTCNNQTASSDSNCSDERESLSTVNQDQDSALNDDDDYNDYNDDDDDDDDDNDNDNDSQGEMATATNISLEPEVILNEDDESEEEIISLT